MAQMSLYRHFSSKDELIVSYLEESNRQFCEWLDGAIVELGDPPENLVGMFEAIEKPSTSPDCLGCTFQGTAAESPDRDHPGHRVALAPEEDGTGWRRGHSGCRSQPKITRTWWVDPSSTRSSSEPGTRVVPSMVKPTTPLVTPLGLLTWIS